MVAITSPIRDPLCDSCLDAGDDEFGLNTDLFYDELDIVLREFGGELADHLCDELETDGEIRCGCGCHWERKAELRK